MSGIAVAKMPPKHPPTHPSRCTNRVDTVLAFTDDVRARNPFLITVFQEPHLRFVGAVTLHLGLSAHWPDSAPEGYIKCGDGPALAELRGLATAVLVGPRATRAVEKLVLRDSHQSMFGPPRAHYVQGCCRNHRMEIGRLAYWRCRRPSRVRHPPRRSRGMAIYGQATGFARSFVA